MFKKHHCTPQLFDILKEVDELGGRVWIMAEEQFDTFFCGVKVFRNPDKRVWEVVQVGPECIKIYRGHN